MQINEREFRQLQLDLKRMMAVNAIQNMMSTTSYMFSIGEYDHITDIFFAKRSDVTACVDGQPVCCGPKAVRELIVDRWEAYAAESSRKLRAQYPDDEDIEGRNGLLDLRALASPIIEVAKDAETAKGLWLVPGTQTFYSDAHGGMQAHWAWIKLAADFVPEGDAWRIWHLVITPCFCAPYEKSWIDAGEGTALAPNPYSIHGSYPHPPRPPKPYATFADTFSY